MLTQFQLRLGKSIAELISTEARPGDPYTWIYRHWMEEIALVCGAITFTVLLLFPWLALVALGQHLNGETGRQTANNLGFGVAMFGVAGIAVHVVRMIGLRLCWNARFAERRRPTWRVQVEPPGQRTQRLLSSTDADAVVQVLVGVAAFLTVWWLYP